MNANKSKNTGGGQTIEPLEPGTYPARLVAVIDLGLQAQRPYKGQEKPPAYSIATTYELVDEFLKDEDGEDDLEKPRWVTEIMPLYSLQSEKAKSTRRYLALDPNQTAGGDWSALIDRPCQVTLVQNKKPDGKVFVNIEAVALMREKDAKRCAPLVNAPIIFDMDDPDPEVWERMPQWLQKIAASNLELKGSKLETLIENAPAKEDSSEPKSNRSAGQAPGGEDEEEEAPY